MNNDTETINVNLMWDYVTRCFGINPREISAKERTRIETQMFGMIYSISPIRPMWYEDDEIR